MERTDFERFLEPEEPKIIGKDWQNEPIHEGDQYIEAEFGAVLLDDLDQYLRSNRLIKTAGEGDF